MKNKMTCAAFISVLAVLLMSAAIAAQNAAEAVFAAAIIETPEIHAEEDTDNVNDADAEAGDKAEENAEEAPTDTAESVEGEAKDDESDTDVSEKADTLTGKLIGAAEEISEFAADAVAGELGAEKPDLTDCTEDAEQEPKDAEAEDTDDEADNDMPRSKPASANAVI